MTMHIFRYISIFVISILALWLGMSFVLAQDDPVIDMHWLMNDMRLSYKDLWDRSSLVDKVVDGQNIFAAWYAHEKYKLFEKEFRVIDLMYEHLTQHEDYCPWWLLLTNENQPRQYLTYNSQKKKTQNVLLSKKDIINVFSLTDQGAAMLWILEWERAFDPSVNLDSDASFLASCKWVQWCQDWLTFKSREDTSNYSERWDIDTCVGTIQRLYSWYDSQIAASLEYDFNRDREIYSNGVVERSRGQFCDINKKLEDISKTISCDAEDLPVYSSFDPQNVDKDESTVRPPEDYESQRNNPPTEWWLEAINNYNPSSGVPQWDEHSESADYLWSSNNWKPSVWPSSTSLESWRSDRLLPKPKVWWVNSLLWQSAWSSTDTSVWANTSLQNIQCEVNEFPDEDESVDIYDEATKLSKFINEYWDQLDTDGRISQVISNPNNLTDEQKESHDIADEPHLDAEQERAVADAVDVLEEEGSEEVAAMKDAFEECIAQETDEDPETVRAQLKKHATKTASVLECLQKVSCKETSDISGLWLFRVRFCAIPSREQSIANILPSMCITDTVEAHQAVVDNMNNSGRMIRHIASKEFLEFQAFDIDYSARFSFGIETNLKRPKHTDNPKTGKLKEQQQFNEMRQVFLWEQEQSNVLSEYRRTILADEERSRITTYNLHDQDSLQKKIEELERVRATEDVDITRRFENQQNSLNLEQLDHTSKVVKDHTQVRKQLADTLETLAKVSKTQYQELWWN